jgi:hypothetical protein
MTAVEFLELMFLRIITFDSEIQRKKYKDVIRQAKEIEKEQKGYSEEEMLKMLHKFGFDYTYNYKGEKTIYEWIPEWFEEHKRLEEIHKNK